MIRKICPQFEFVIPGNTISVGRYGLWGRSKNVVRQSTQRQKELEYVNYIRSCCKSALANSDWTLTDQAVYVAIIIYLKPVEKIQLERWAQRKKETHFATIQPRITRFEKLLYEAIKGLLIKKETQIVGKFALKMFDYEPRIEVVIGRPETMEGVLYDLRNI